MGKIVKRNQINELAKAVKSTVEKTHKLPSTVTAGGVTLTKCELAYLFSFAINHDWTGIEVPEVRKETKSYGDEMSVNIYASDYHDQARRIVQHIKQNGSCPNYTRTIRGNMRASIDLYIYSFSKILVFFYKKGQMPNYCLYQSSVFVEEPPSTKVETPQQVLNYFKRVFGEISCLDDALEKVYDKGYAYYYNDAYTNKESIDRIKAGKGINCTDACHVFYNIAVALGIYKKVDVLHVLCSQGDGHVRLRITLPDGDVFYRDPACTLDWDSSGAYCNWCTQNYTILAVNPYWFMKDINR